MIEGGWFYVYASYAVAGLSLIALALGVMLNIRHWARRAKELEEPK